MGVKADEMKELMGQLSGPRAKPELSQSEKEMRKPLPPEILMDAKQDRVHVEKISPRKLIKKRIVFRKAE